MNEIIYDISESDYNIVEETEYSSDLEAQFKNIPIVAKYLIKNAKHTMSGIENMLYYVPSFVNLVKSSIPETSFQAVLSSDQKDKLAKGAIKLMTKKDGTLMANLVNPNTNKIVGTIPLKEVQVNPDIAQSVANFTTQMQMAQIAEKIQEVQLCIDEVRQGQENDRLAIAYSCQQMFIQASSINNLELKRMALLRIVADAENARNMLMLSQKANVKFIQNQPEAFIEKMLKGASPDKIESRMNELRDNLEVVNMVSLVEAMTYHVLGEYEAAKHCLDYYAEFIEETYLEPEGLVERLDMIDPSPENYWSKTIPEIRNKIALLPKTDTNLLEDEEGDEQNG